MGRLWLIAARNILEHRRRSLMLGGAIALVTVLLVLLVGISGGMQATLLRSATTLMTGHVNVGGFYKVTTSTAGPMVTRYAALEGIVEAAVPELDYLVDRLRGWGKIISETSSQNASLIGVDIEQEKRFGEVVDVLEGDIADLAEPGTALIFATQAERLEVGIGDRLTVVAPTLRGVNNTVDVRVVAIAGDIGYISSFSIYVPGDVVRDLYQVNRTTTGVLMLYLKDRDEVSEVAEHLRKVIEDAGYRVMEPEALPFFMKMDSVNREDWQGQKIDVTTWEDEVSLLSLTVAAFDGISGLLVAILLVIIVVGIMNTLFMAIRERTNEIGTMRAIGMQQSRVLAMFVIEAFLLSATATLLGTGIGVGLAALINHLEVAVYNEAIKVFLMSDTLMLDVDLASVTRSLLTVVGATTGFSLLPAWSAARMRPVTAIHHAG